MDPAPLLSEHEMVGAAAIAHASPESSPGSAAGLIELESLRNTVIVDNATDMISPPCCCCDTHKAKV